MRRKLLAAGLAALLLAIVSGCAQEPASEASQEMEAVSTTVVTTSEAARPSPSSALNVLDAEEVGEAEESAGSTSAAQMVTPAQVGIRPGSAEDYTEGVLRSSGVHLLGSDLYLAYQDRLLRAPLTETGEIEEATALIGVMPTIHTLASDGQSLFMATNDGIFCFSIDELEEAEMSQATVLSSRDTAMYPFYVWEDWLFFLFNNEVYVVPKAGGSEKILLTDVTDFQVTNRGIYATHPDGSLSLLSFADGSDTTLLQEGCGGRITFLEDTAYITTGEETAMLYAYNAPEQQGAQIELTQTLSAYHGIWPEPGGLVCQTADGRVILYDLGAHSETELGEYNMPYYEDGELADGVIYNNAGEKLSWMHLATGETGEVMIPDILTNPQEEA